MSGRPCTPCRSRPRRNRSDDLPLLAAAASHRTASRSPATKRPPPTGRCPTPWAGQWPSRTEADGGALTVLGMPGGRGRHPLDAPTAQRRRAAAPRRAARATSESRIDSVTPRARTLADSCPTPSPPRRPRGVPSGRGSILRSARAAGQRLQPRSIFKSQLPAGGARGHRRRPGRRGRTLGSCLSTRGRVGRWTSFPMAACCPTRRRCPRDLLHQADAWRRGTPSPSRISTCRSKSSSVRERAARAEPCVTPAPSTARVAGHNVEGPSSVGIHLNRAPRAQFWRRPGALLVAGRRSFPASARARPTPAAPAPDSGPGRWKGRCTPAAQALYDRALKGFETRDYAAPSAIWRRGSRSIPGASSCSPRRRPSGSPATAGARSSSTSAS